MSLFVVNSNPQYGRDAPDSSAMAPRAIAPSVVEEVTTLNPVTSILVIDDQIDSLRALSELLSQQAYVVRRAISGALGLRSALAEPPALILLDITMPEMDGYEVCRQLKATEVTCDIPVIFISALGNVLDKEKAFSLGGADYISKPFQAGEVLMRVRNQLTIAQQQWELRLQNQQLREEISRREVAETQYRGIFENATEGIFQISPEGKFLSVNPALLKLLGYDSLAHLQQHITHASTQLYVQPERRKEIQVYLNQCDRITDVQTEIYRRDRSRLWISENIRAVRDDAGNLLYYEGTVQDITDRHRAELEMRRQRRQVEHLLYNVLPHQIAQKLQQRPRTIADQFDEVTVLFADLVDFTRTSASMTPRDLVELLNDIFSAFDALVEKAGVEKIKTVGDEYMAAAGLPTARGDHAEAIATLALNMQAAVKQFLSPEGNPFKLRIGINTGSVVAGVIGTKKFAYDLWGDTVNVASRMESTGLAGRIQVSEATYLRLKESFVFESREQVEVKGKGLMTTYWLVAPQPHAPEPPPEGGVSPGN